MSIYFIHAEVLDGDRVVTKVSAIVISPSATEAFNWFVGRPEVEKHRNDGHDVVIDKLEKVE